MSRLRHTSNALEKMFRLQSTRRKRVSLFGFLLALVLLMVSGNNMASDNTLRRPASGPVKGLIDENGTFSWLGVPYAQPPVGELRWKAPRPLEPSEEVIHARAFGSICSQLGSPLLEIDSSLYGKPVGSEDCLYLNIWAPPHDGGAQSERIPVMVWIHGGSNVGGSGNFYYGGNLARQQNVLVVTINYRLGLLGWFSHPSLRENAETTLDRSSNFGTLDVIQALKWVNQNIQAFGGDPGNITVFGESAGAMNILTLLYSPLAEGLFHKAIMQSGSLRQTPVAIAENFSADDRSEFSSTETAAKILLSRGGAETREQAREKVAGLDNGEFLSLMRSTTDDELIQTYTADIGAAIRAPQIIPDGIVVPEGPAWDLISAAGAVHKVPVLIGSNRDEMKFFLGLSPHYVKIVPGSEIIIHNPEIYNLHARYLSDRWTSLGVDELALRLTRNNPDVFAYRFDWDDQPSYPQADFRDFFGAAHTMELPFVFNDFDGMKVYAYYFTEQNRVEREKLAGQIGEYWANFAYTGKPAKGRSGELPLWPAWGDGNKLILDSANDGGLQQQPGVLTFKSLHERLGADDSFPTEQDKGAFYQAMFYSREAWPEYFLPRWSQKGTTQISQE